jgi:GNAT superfamily N-acetyltransferase
LKKLDDITIRPLEDADVVRILPYFDGLSPATRSTYHPFKFNQDDVTRIGLQLHADHSARVGAFCNDGGAERMVGHVWYSHEGSYGNPGLGIGVIDDFQSRGIGQMLMQKIDEIARSRGELQIELSVYPDNDQAMRVYTKAGYRVVGRTVGGGQLRMVLKFAERPVSV